MMTLPDTWAWDDFDMLDIEDKRVESAARKAEIVVRQKNKIAESLAYNTCDSVHFDEE